MDWVKTPNEIAEEWTAVEYFEFFAMQEIVEEEREKARKEARREAKNKSGSG